MTKHYACRQYSVILDNNMNVMVLYKYDAYGNLISMTDASGGVKIAAKQGAKTGKSGGINLCNTEILSPDAAWQKNNGGTLLKVGKIFRIDVGSNTLLHMHIPNVLSHIQIGAIGAGIYGGLR